MDPELRAMGIIAQALTELSDEQRRNVLLYVNARFRGQAAPLRVAADSTPIGELNAEQYESLGDFFDAANPQTEADRVLTIGYWLQALKGASDFESYPVNKELKNLGHPVSNITRALDSMIDRSPRLVLQISKTGSSKQARKRYKITREGIKRIQGMLAQNSGEKDGS